MVNIEIVPKDIVTTKTIKSIKIEQGEVILGSSVKFPVRFFDGNDNLLEVKFITISGDEYKNWGNDDSYIYDRVMSNLEVREAPMAERKLVKLAESLIDGQGDGRLSMDDSMKILSEISDDGVYSFFEKRTLAYIRKNFKWTDAAIKLFDEKVKGV